MRSLFLSGLIIFASGCRRFEPPIDPTPGQSGCTQDADCGGVGKGICFNGTCISGCRHDNDCLGETCGHQNDGGIGSCNACEVDADCGSGRKCLVAASGNTCYSASSCTTTSDCDYPQVCATFDGNGTCEGECRVDADCDAGFCISASGEPGTCSTGAGGVTYCHSDADCSACAQCASSNGGLGVCYQVGDAGVPIVGDITSLKLRDNLAGAMDYIETTNPSLELFQITGVGLSASGTIDITTAGDFSWSYEFANALGDAAIVTFGESYHRCGFVTLTEVDDISLIAPSSVPLLLDSPALVSSFAAQPGCTAPTGRGGDTLNVEGLSDGGASYDLGTTPGQEFFGNAFTGQGTADCE